MMGSHHQAFETYRRTGSSGAAVAVVVIVLLVMGFAGYYLLYVRPAAIAGQGTGSPTAAASTVISTTTVTQTIITSVNGSGQSAGQTVGNYTVCFSPGNDCAQDLIDAINGAKTSLFIMIYTFDDQNISAAVIAAENRGVNVKMLMDTSQSETSEQQQVVQQLQQAGVPLIIYNPPNGILHDKLAIIDNQTVVTGSFNWSYAANYDNDENLLIVHSPALAQQYLTDFEKVWTIASSSESTQDGSAT